MTPVLDQAQIDRFHRDGFAVIDRLVPDDALAVLRTAYDELIDGGGAPGDRLLGGLTRQVMRPADTHPVFADNPAFRRGVAIAEALLGGPVERAFDMLIYKQPGHPHETPWHQDASYSELPFAPAGAAVPLGALQFWVALDDVDTENGCMHFVPRRQHTLLQHHVASGDPDDPGRLLALDDPETQLDLSTAVAAPLRAGGCTIHSYGTPHYTPPNRSTTRPRRAYIFNLAPAA